MLFGNLRGSANRCIYVVTGGDKLGLEGIELAWVPKLAPLIRSCVHVSGASLPGIQGLNVPTYGLVERPHELEVRNEHVAQCVIIAAISGEGVSKRPRPLQWQRGQM